MFSSNRSGGKLDLWELSNWTGAVKRVTDNDAEDWDPAFMPDGSKILWSSNRSCNFEIWTAEPDGSSPRQVSHDGADAENPTATPDGWVVYASGNPEKMGLWKVRLDGSSATRILPGNPYYGEVSPDGKYAAYVIPNTSDQYLLEVVRVADGQVLPFQVPLPIVNQAISASIGRPRWMPGGRAIAFVGQDEKGVSGIFVQDFIPDQNTSTTRRPLAGFDPEFATESFAISPDGNRMMIASWEQLFNLMLVENAPGVTRGK
jgi:Tol biopolymer transport system component